MIYDTSGNTQSSTYFFYSHFFRGQKKRKKVVLCNDHDEQDQGRVHADDLLFSVDR